MNKKVLISVIAIVLVAAIAVGAFLLSRPKTVEGAKTITVTVVHKDGTSKDFTYHTDEEFLGPVLLNEKLVEGENGEWGLYITSVDGEACIYEEDGSYWALYIGSEYAMTGADTTPVNDGDTFSLVATVG